MIIHGLLQRITVGGGWRPTLDEGGVSTFPPLSSQDDAALFFGSFALNTRILLSAVPNRSHNASQNRIHRKLKKIILEISRNSWLDQKNIRHGTDPTPDCRRELRRQAKSLPRRPDCPIVRFRRGTSTFLEDGRGRGAGRGSGLLQRHT